MSTVLSSGVTLAAGLDSGQVDFWDVYTGKLLERINHVESGVGSIDWQSSLVAVSWVNNDLQLFDFKSKKKQRVAILTSEVRTVKFSKDSSFLAALDKQSRIHMWNLTKITRAQSNKCMGSESIAWHPFKRNILCIGCNITRTSRKEVSLQRAVRIEYS